MWSFNVYTEYVDYVTFVYGYVHVWCCHKFVCLCIKCVVEGQRAGTCNSGLCGFICTAYLIRRVIGYKWVLCKLFPSLRASEKDCSRQLEYIPTVMDSDEEGTVMGRKGQ